MHYVLGSLIVPFICPFICSIVRSDIFTSISLERFWQNRQGILTSPYRWPGLTEGQGHTLIQVCSGECICINAGRWSLYSCYIYFWNNPLNINYVSHWGQTLYSFKQTVSQLFPALLLCPWERLRSIVMRTSVCVGLSALCLFVRISPEPHVRSLKKILCMLPMAVA